MRQVHETSLLQAGGPHTEGAGILCAWRMRDFSM